MMLIILYFICFLLGAISGIVSFAYAIKRFKTYLLLIIGVYLSVSIWFYPLIITKIAFCFMWGLLICWEYKKLLQVKVNN